MSNSMRPNIRKSSGIREDPLFGVSVMEDRYDWYCDADFKNWYIWESGELKDAIEELIAEKALLPADPPVVLRIDERHAPLELKDNTDELLQRCKEKGIFLLLWCADGWDDPAEIPEYPRHSDVIYHHQNYFYSYTDRCYIATEDVFEYEYDGDVVPRASLTRGLIPLSDEQQGVLAQRFDAPTLP